MLAAGRIEASISVKEEAEEKGSKPEREKRSRAKGKEGKPLTRTQPH